MAQFMKLDLTDEEILSLEGSSVPSIVKAIGEIRRKQELSENSWIGRILAEAEVQGELRLTYSRVRDCSECSYSAGYALFKSGPRKGKPNYDKPLSKAGVRADFGNVRVVFGKGKFPGGYDHICNDCWAAGLELEFNLAYPKIQAEIRTLTTNNGKRKSYAVLCVDCNWSGWEHELGKLPALMSGTYEGKCPKCGAENRPFLPDKIKRSYQTWIIVDRKA